MICNHYVLVAASIPNREPPGVICIEYMFVYYLHIQFIYRVIPKCWFIYFLKLFNSLLVWLLRFG